MSLTIDFITSGGVSRNMQPRAVLDSAVDRITAAKGKVATNPQVACIELDEAMKSCARVIRGLNPVFDFGLPDTQALEAKVLQLQALNNDLQSQLDALRTIVEPVIEPVIEPVPPQPDLKSVAPPPPAISIEAAEPPPEKPARGRRKLSEALATPEG